MKEFNYLGLEYDHAQIDLNAIECIALFYGDFHSGMECIEIGSWVGRSAIVFAKHFRKVFCVDAWDGRTAGEWGYNPSLLQPDRTIFDVFCENVKDYLFDVIFPVPTTSAFAASIWKRPVNLIFIDGDHSYDAVRADILGWLPHLYPGGLMIFHDYDHYEGVTRAVNELCPGAQKEAKSVAWWRKP